jgi:hypothetical protein
MFMFLGSRQEDKNILKWFPELYYIFKTYFWHALPQHWILNVYIKITIEDPRSQKSILEDWCFCEQ